MTLHSVSIAVECIMKRKKLEIRMQAAFVGAKFSDEEEDEEVKLTEKQEMAIKRAVAERKERHG